MTSGHVRWAAVRARVRHWLGAHLDDADLTTQLLPHDPEEPRDPAATPAGTWNSLAELVAEYPSLLAPSLRKRRGAWFTPPDLAAATAERTLAPLLATANGKPLRICDPAVGGGAFLVAAYEQLVAHGMTPRAAVACLHGLDIDSTVAALAAVTLWRACGAETPDLLAIAANVHGGDGLRTLPAGTFDAVLTNPPWETLQSSEQARLDAAALRSHFEHQGKGKLYTYRLFVERSHQLLRDGGRFGLVTPASLWFDRDARPLRQLLLEQCDWEWLFGFENRRSLFAIDTRYRFAIVVGRKGGCTAAVRVAFGRVAAADWTCSAPRHTAYPRDWVDALSPVSGAFVELDDARDLRVLRRMANDGVPLTGAGGVFVWRQGDFNMTSDRHRFVLRDAAERDGYVRGEDGRWHRGAQVLRPLYQGAMVHDLHPNTGAYKGGAGRATTWTSPHGPTDLRPQYLVADDTVRGPARIVLRALSNATNARTAIACLLDDVACGNSLGVMTPRLPSPTPLRTMAAGAAILGSLPFDYALRLRLSGTNLNRFVLADCRLPRLTADLEAALAELALQLCAILPWQATLWRLARAEGWCSDRAEPALSPGARAELLTHVDVLVGRAYGLQGDDIAWIMRGCDQPSTAAPTAGTPPGASLRGFWRVDRDLPVAQRRPNRWLRAATTDLA